jgi:hypothetical protein
MRYTYTKALSDSELAIHLRALDHVILSVLGLHGRDLERQLDRLGFGERFLVTETKSEHGECCRIDPVKCGPFSNSHC